MMQRLMIPTVLAAFLAGCAPAFDRPAFLATLVGQPEAAVVRQLGVPSRTYETNGRKFLAYSERRVEVVPVGLGYGYGYFGPSFGYSPSQIIERACETTFEVGDGRVLTWSLRGNAC